MNIIDKNLLLSEQEKELLTSCVQPRFNFGGFKSISIDKLLSQLKVYIKIEPGTVSRSIPTELDEALKFWGNEIIRIKDTNSKEYKEANKKYILILEEMKVWNTMSLRGLYDPVDNVIKLFPEVMHQAYGGKRMNELLVSTLVHEAMHAYFNRPGHNQFPYAIFVEEPLAEFGMLLYLYETGSIYYKWAIADVSYKKTVYKYGADLMKQYIAEGTNSPTREYLEAYKVNLNVNDIPDYPQHRSRGKFDLPQPTSVYKYGQQPTLIWKDFLQYPPRYFYDSEKKILGLDGEWDKISPKSFKYLVRDIIKFNKPFKYIYLGVNFSFNTGHNLDIFSRYEVIVSPFNRNYSSVDFIPIYQDDKSPALCSCGDGYYKLYRHNYWGIIDAQLNPITDFIYDSIRSFDKNNLIRVQRYNIDNEKYKLYYGLVNKQGFEQVRPIYDNISNMNSDGSYTVKQNGVKFKIDQYGNKVP